MLTRLLILVIGGEAPSGDAVPRVLEDFGHAAGKRLTLGWPGELATGKPSEILRLADACDLYVIALEPTPRTGTRRRTLPARVLFATLDAAAFVRLRRRTATARDLPPHPPAPWPVPVPPAAHWHAGVRGGVDLSAQLFGRTTRRGIARLMVVRDESGGLSVRGPGADPGPADDETPAARERRKPPRKGPGARAGGDGARGTRLQRRETLRLPPDPDESWRSWDGPSKGGLSVAVDAPRRRDTRTARTPQADAVKLRVAAPPAVRPGDAFVARFAAYVGGREGEVGRLLRGLDPKARLLPGREAGRWKRDTRVTVSAHGEDLRVSRARQSFVWQGGYALLDFPVRVPARAGAGARVLSFDVAVEGVCLLTLALGVEVGGDARPRPARVVNATSPRHGFASYASADREQVAGRLSSVEAATGMRIFMDCLDLRAGEAWKPALQRRIGASDAFLLFWSRHARASRWCAWEREVALAAERAAGRPQIQVHPLESPRRVAPPPELAHLNFADRYLWLQPSRPGRRTTR